MEVHQEIKDNNSGEMINIICVAYKRVIPLRILIDSFLVQTDPRWRLYIVHDGPAPDSVKNMIAHVKDQRVSFEETDIRRGLWGHPNRQMMLKRLPFNHSDYLLMTNDDNYYTPIFVQMMLVRTRSQLARTGMVFCDTVHNYTKYEVLKTRLKVGSVDMGSFIVRMDIAKKIGFNYMVMEADGKYAEECANYCKKSRLNVQYIPKALFIHN